LTDITIPAQKFLSCVKRADEKFGAGHIADILLGSKNEKIIRWEHDKLSTYAIGKEYTKKQWMHVARQLLSMGYLKQDGEYHTLSLTAKALEALKKRETIMGVVQEADSEGRVRKDGRKKSEELEYHRGLFAILRQKRKEIADAGGVPPYVIFPDKTLIEMAAYYPQSRDSLLAISGVGQVKASQYGDEFLNVVVSFCEKHDIKEKPRETRRGQGDANRRYMIIGEAFNRGARIDELIKQYQVTNSTILDNLLRYAVDGNKLLNIDELRRCISLPAEKIQAAFAIFEREGTTFLKPVFDGMSGSLTYDELKILRLLYLAENGS
jgi:ATP-dependent DNA helicase RecQ